MATAPADLARLQAMDPAAWQALQDEFFARVYYYCKRQVRDHQTAEDITQEVFLGAVRGIAGFDPLYTMEQFLFGIARNRLIDQFRRNKPVLGGAVSAESGTEHNWVEQVPDQVQRTAREHLVAGEDEARRSKVLAAILKEHVGELWQAGEFKKLMVLEALFVLGMRNKDAAVRCGIADEKLVAGIKFRAVERLRGLARQHDPNHSLFLGLWEPGAR